MIFNILNREILGVLVFAAFSATSAQGPPTTLPPPECPEFTSMYSGNQLILDIVPGECQMVIQPHDHKVLKKINKKMNKKIKIKRKIQYPDVTFRSVRNPIEENSTTDAPGLLSAAWNNPDLSCVMPIRHRGPFVVMDTAGDCQLIIAIRRERMSGPVVQNDGDRARPRGRGRKAKGMRRRNRNKAFTYKPVVQYVAGSGL